MNLSNKQPIFIEDQVIKNTNLSQDLPNTEIGKGIKGLVFIGCNLVNCKLPVDATKIDCLHIQKDFCYHSNQK